MAASRMVVLAYPMCDLQVLAGRFSWPDVVTDGAVYLVLPCSRDRGERRVLHGGLHPYAPPMGPYRHLGSASDARELLDYFITDADVGSHLSCGLTGLPELLDVPARPGLLLWFYFQNYKGTLECAS